MQRNDVMNGVRITVEFSGDVDGPSAGSVMCLSILSAMDGRTLPEDFAMTGTIMPDGTIKDSSYRMIGKVEKDGTVKDSSYRFIGKVKDDGTVVDQSYRMIGQANGVPATYVAVMYFFKLLP